jgi:2-methylcitrate dehydratase PrpD
MAILLIEGRAGLTEFTDEVVRRPDVQAMIERIDFVVDDEAERAGYDKMTTFIDIDLKDGRRISGRADFGKGSPAEPMSYAEVADKFRENAAFARFDRQRAETIVAVVADLETIGSIGEVTDLLLTA